MKNSPNGVYKSVCVIGDVHGCYKTLRALINKLPKGEKLCFVGDLIDKGPNSRDVVQYVIDNGWDCCLGNHEDMMLKSGGAPRLTGQWCGADAWATMNSYDDTPEDDALWDKHREWIRALPHYLTYVDIKNNLGQYLFVSHAGIPYLDLEQACRTNEILWNRDGVTQYGNAFNVFGHSPKSEPVIGEYYANIDTGCFFTKTGHGVLTALRFPQMEIYQQENIDQEYGDSAGKRYILLYSEKDDTEFKVRNFSSRTTALRWVQYFYPLARFKIIHGQELGISVEHRETTKAHMKTGSWMDPLSKDEWDDWADENLTEAERKHRLATCWSCNLKQKPPTKSTGFLCWHCGRTQFDPLFVK